MTRTVTINGLAITFPDDLALVFDNQGVTITRTVQGPAVTRELVRRIVNHTPVPDAIQKLPKHRPLAIAADDKRLTRQTNVEESMSLLPGNAGKIVLAELKKRGGAPVAGRVFFQAIFAGKKHTDLPWYASKQLANYLQGMANRGEILIQPGEGKRGSVAFYSLPAKPARAAPPRENQLQTSLPSGNDQEEG